jgi:hypothetical protein
MNSHYLTPYILVIQKNIFLTTTCSSHYRETDVFLYLNTFQTCCMKLRLFCEVRIFL